MRMAPHDLLSDAHPIHTPSFFHLTFILSPPITTNYPQLTKNVEQQ
jgi:hypothetical protein